MCLLWESVDQFGLLNYVSICGTFSKAFSDLHNATNLIKQRSSLNVEWNEVESRLEKDEKKSSRKRSVKELCFIQISKININIYKKAESVLYPIILKDHQWEQMNNGTRRWNNLWLTTGDTVGISFGSVSRILKTTFGFRKTQISIDARNTQKRFTFVKSCFQTTRISR